MRVRLAPGTDSERAIAVVKQLAGNTTLGVTGPHPADKQQAYVLWVMNVEAHSQSVLHREDVEWLVDTPRHRVICSAAPGPQLLPLINAELSAKSQRLMEMVEYLERHRDRLLAAEGLPIVVDTMVLLQCHRLDQVKWSNAVPERARVMVPLRVVEEIEDKKYSDSKRLSRRARGLLPWIDKHFVEDSPGPVFLAEGATIELVLAERPRYRPQSADDEILEVAQDVLKFVGRVKIMTADTGMRARARGEGLDVLRLPDDWQVPVDDETS